MSANTKEHELSNLSPDFRRLLEIQLTTFIDFLDEAAVRARGKSISMIAVNAPVVDQSVYRARRASTPAA